MRFNLISSKWKWIILHVQGVPKKTLLKEKPITSLRSVFLWTPGICKIIFWNWTPIFSRLTSKVRAKRRDPSFLPHHMQQPWEDILEMTHADLLHFAVVIRTKAIFCQFPDPVCLNRWVYKCWQGPVNSGICYRSIVHHTTLTCLRNVLAKMAPSLRP